MMAQPWKLALPGSSNRSLAAPCIAASATSGGIVSQEGKELRRARVTCVNSGGGDSKRDAARRALEAALGEKQDAFKKWDESLKKKEAGGGGGKGRGRGWGGGGGGGAGSNGGDKESSWDEALQIVYAFAGLIGLYLILTQGKSILAVILNSILYASRGFKPRKRTTPPLAPASGRGSATSESHVRSKWGSD